MDKEKTAMKAMNLTLLLTTIEKAKVSSSPSVLKNSEAKWQKKMDSIIRKAEGGAYSQGLSIGDLLPAIQTVEKRLDILGVPKNDRYGITLFVYRGKKDAKTQQNTDTCICIKLERKRSGWYLISASQEQYQTGWTCVCTPEAEENIKKCAFLAFCKYQ